MNSPSLQQYNRYIVYMYQLSLTDSTQYYNIWQSLRTIYESHTGTSSTKLRGENVVGLQVL